MVDEIDDEPNHRRLRPMGKASDASAPDLDQPGECWMRPRDDAAVVQTKADPVVTDEPRVNARPIGLVEHGETEARLAGPGRPAQQDAVFAENEAGRVNGLRCRLPRPSRTLV